MKKRNAKKLISATIILSSVFTPVSMFAATSGAGSVVTGSEHSTAAFLDAGRAASWAQDALTQAKQLGLVHGDPDGNYRPLDTITRLEVATVLVNLLKLPAPAVASSPFTDGSSANWGLENIVAVKNAGLMLGDPDGKFRPNDPITREELAVVLVRAAKGTTQGKGAHLAVADKDKVDNWAKDAVQEAIELGLMKGDGTNFNPRVNALRQEIAVTAVRLSGMNTSGEGQTSPTAVAPVISNVSIVSNNPDHTKAMNGDIITLTFTADAPVTKLSNFKINGSNPDTFEQHDGNVYTATHLVDSGDVVGKAATFQINVKNAAGIYSQTIEQTTDGSSVTIY